MSGFVRGLIALAIVAAMTALGTFGGCTAGLFTTLGRKDGGVAWNLLTQIGLVVGLLFGIFLAWRYYRGPYDVHR